MKRWNLALKKSPRVLSVLLSVTMSMSLFGSFAQAVSAAENTGEETQVLTESEKAELSQKGKESHSSDSGKSETVYVLTDANGKSREVIVSEWLRNREGSRELSDSSQLTDIENVEGYETYTRNEDGTLTWAAQGNDIYYQGRTDKALPVDVKVTYKLDGKEISPSDLAGKSGQVTIRFDYENHETRKVLVNGKTETVYVPFAMVSGCILDNDHFSSIKVTNGKVISEGENNIVVGLAFPGLKESLNLQSLKGDLDDEKIRDRLDEMEEDIPDYIEITAQAEDFDLDMTMTMASTGLLDQLDLDTDLDLGDLEGSMEDLKDATNELIDGVKTLKDGTGEFREGTSSLSDGARKLDEGAGTLKDGTAALAEGSGKLQEGAGALKEGTKKLSDGTGELAGASSQLSAGVSQLKAGADQLNSGSSALSDGADALAEGAGEVDQNMQKVLTALEQDSGLLKGTEALDEGIARLLAGIGSSEDAQSQDGPETLYAGAAKLMAASGQLSQGAEDLKKGAESVYAGIGQVDEKLGELSDGLDSIAEGTKALQDALEGDGNTPGLVKGTEAICGGLSTVNDTIQTMDQGLGAALGSMDPREIREALSALSDVDAQDVKNKAEKLAQAGETLGTVKTALESRKSSFESERDAALGTAQSYKQAMDEALEKMDAAKDSAASSQGGETPAAPSPDAVRNALENLQADAEAGLDEEGNAYIKEKSVSGRNELESALNAYISAVDEYQTDMEAYADSQKVDNSGAKADYEKARKEYDEARDNYISYLEKGNQAAGAASALDQVIGTISGFDTQTLGSSARELSGMLDRLAELKEQADHVDSMLDQMDQLLELKKGMDALADSDSGVPYLLANLSAVKDGLLELDSAQNVPALSQGTEQAARGLDQIIAAIESEDDPETDMDETGLLQGAKAVYQGASTLAAAMEQAQAGSSSLAEAVKTVGDNVKTMKDGSSALAQGSRQLDQGLQQLQKEGTSRVAAGASDLKKGADQLRSGADALDQGITQLHDRSGALIEGTGSLYEGAKQLDAGAGELRDGIAAAAEGAGKLSEGAGALKDGTSALADGADRLDEGAGKLDDGVQELLDGMLKYNEEGIEKITGLFGDSLTVLEDRLDAIRKAASSYKNYGGALEDENNEVKFIFKTDAVSKDEE